LNSQINEGIFTLFEKRRDYSASRYLIGFGNLISMMNLSIKYISNNNITFTDEEVKDFLERHPLEEICGIQFPKANETTKTVKDYLMLSLFQAGKVLSDERAFKVRDILLLKYVESCHPDLMENIEGLKQIYDDFITDYKERIISVIFIFKFLDGG